MRVSFSVIHITQMVVVDGIPKIDGLLLGH